MFAINFEALSKKIQDPSQLRVPPNIHSKMGFCTKNRVTAENLVRLQKCTPHTLRMVSETQQQKKWEKILDGDFGGEIF